MPHEPDLVPVIQSASDRVHYAEARRVNFTVMAGLLVASGFTVMTVALGSIEGAVVRDAALSASSGSIALGLSMLWLYAHQTNRYPFTDATTNYKWFYRDALDDRAKFKSSWWALFRPKKEVARITSEYAAQLPEYITKISTIDDKSHDRDQDRQQLYTLHVNELYKNLYLGQLRDLFNSGIVGIIILAALGAAYGWRESCRHSQVQTLQAVAGLTGDIRARSLSDPYSKQQEIVFSGVVRNRTRATARIVGLQFEGRGHWPVPAEIVLIHPNADAVVLPGNAVPVRGTASLSREAWQSVSRVRVIPK